MKNKTTLTILILSLLFFTGPSPAWAGCDDAYNLTDHDEFGVLDICSIESEIRDEGWQALTNWGSRPEWYDETSILFLSNTMGDVYYYDLDTNTVDILSDHFNHSGFSRVYKLPNNDLLLVGRLDGGQCTNNTHPLRLCADKRFEGYMYVLQYPYDNDPIPLHEPAWEGVAVSTINNQIAWSDGRDPFEGKNLLETILNYMFKRSNIWTATVAYNSSGLPYLANKRKLIDKYNIGSVFLEPQNFKGSTNDKLTFSAYGVGAEGKSDVYTYNCKKNKIKKINLNPGYNEWEGIHPSFQWAFVENDPSTNLLTDWNNDLYLYDFQEKELVRYTYFRDIDDLFGFHISNPVFSPNGTKVLAAAAVDNTGVDDIGNGIGLVIRDFYPPNE